MSEKILKISGRSKKYSANKALVDQATKSLPVSVEEAVGVLQSLTHPSFKNGVSVELHVNLNINPTKSDQFVRGSVVLPHGTGKKVKIAAFVSDAKADEAKKAGAEIVGGEDLIEEIKKTNKINFDIAVAEPAMMTKLPTIARLLGTAGVMPNPKTGTVGENISEIVELIKKGKVDFKNDKSGNIHILVGKISNEFSKEQLIENINSAIEAVEKVKPEAVKKKFFNTIHIACSMSPSVKIAK
jgi:large subunit ribosomal protein L1